MIRDNATQLRPDPVVTFRATDRTHPARRVFDGRAVVAVVDHYGGREPQWCARVGVDPADAMRFGVTFADGSGTFASAREIGRA